MESTTCEPPVADAEPASSRPWLRDAETSDVESIQLTTHEETPTEPGYGHGV